MSLGHFLAIQTHEKAMQLEIGVRTSHSQKRWDPLDPSRREFPGVRSTGYLFLDRCAADLVHRAPTGGHLKPMCFSVYKTFSQ